MASDGSLPRAGDTARDFLAARQQAWAAARDGRIDEAAAAFDRAREAAIAIRARSEDVEPLVALIGIAPAVAESAIAAGRPGCGQGIIDWLTETGAVAAEVLRPLVEAADSPAVPVALRSRLPLADPDPSDPVIDPAWRAAFDAAVAHARDWRLAKAVEAFRGLPAAGGRCRPVLVDTALVCEWLARPAEAAEAWRAVAGLDGTPHDVAVESIGRAIALEAEADPGSGPRVSFVQVTAVLDGVAPGAVGHPLDQLESRLGVDPRVRATPIDASAWTAAGAAAPRSAWWVCDEPPDDGPPLLLASLLLFGPRKGRGAEAVLRGFDADLAAARPLAESILGHPFGPPANEPGMPAITPTEWLMASQVFRPEPEEPRAAADLDRHRETCVRRRLVAVWPDTPLPELRGLTPRQAVADPEGSLRVEAIILEGESAAGSPVLSAAWADVRAAVGLPAPRPIIAREPLDDVSPLRWHQLEMGSLPAAQLRGLYELARDAGFEAAARRAADAIRSRGEPLPA